MKAIIKIIEIYVLRILMYILYFFPIKRNRIVFNAYTGTQYACNPKYISEYLMKEYPGKFEIVWAFKDVDKFSFLKNYGIKVVNYASLKRFYYEATCKVSVNNIGSFSWFPLRKGQEHVNTWHGSAGIKKCGLGEVANSKLMKKTIQMSSDNTTAMVSTSKKYEQYVCKDDLGFNGEILRIGYPRNDLFLRKPTFFSELRKKVSDYYKIDEEAYIILYAPTWRYDVEKSIAEPDFEAIRTLLEKKLNREVVVLSRLHHFSMYSGAEVKGIIDATTYADMQELLCASDMLITDYSTSMWDFSIMGKPILLYTPDVEEYVGERGFHEEICNWGLPYFSQNDDLIAFLERVEFDDFASIDANYRMKQGDYESGMACQLMAEWIIMHCDD